MFCNPFFSVDREFDICWLLCVCRCGHCKALAPEYAKAAQSLADAPVKLAKVDATVHDSLAKAFSIRGFPTLKFFKNGKASDYTGGRTEKDIVTWLQKKIGPAFHVVSSEADLERLQEAHEAIAVGVFSSVESDEAKVFIAAADSDDGHIYAVTADAGVKSKLAVGDNTVVLLKAYDDLRNDFKFEDETTTEDVTGFVAKKSTPWVQVFSAENSKKIFSSPVTKHVLFFTNDKKDHHEPTMATFREVAQEFQGDFLFVNVPASESKILQYFEIAVDQLPATILADLGAESGMLKYPFSGEHSTAAVRSFLGDFKAGKLAPHLKSEDVEEEDTEGDVVVVRGKSFHDIVVNNDKDVLLEFYAPWCGHCKQLAPTWEELGKKLRSQRDKVVIAKMDATANEIQHAGVSVRGFPTIYFFPGNDKSNPVRYENSRELDGFLQFLAEKGSHKVEAGDDDHDEL